MRRCSIKTIGYKTSIALLMVFPLISVPALGQYEIGWCTIDGGGGVSSGGQS